jgi:hypothetical protein
MPVLQQMPPSTGTVLSRTVVLLQLPSKLHMSLVQGSKSSQHVSGIAEIVTVRSVPLMQLNMQPSASAPGAFGRQAKQGGQLSVFGVNTQR